MLRSAIVSLSLMFLICASAFAQDSKVQVFGGYSLVHTGGNNGVDGPALDSALGATPGTFSVKTNYSGWNGAIQFNANKWFGIKADIGGNYGTPISASSGSGITGLPGLSSYSYLFGPVFSAHSNRFTPYVHTLFGVNRTSLHSTNNLSDGTTTISLPEVTDSAFAMALGGGIDYNVTKRFGLRLGQFDYLYTGHDLNAIGNNLLGPGTFTGLDTHQNNFRFATGVVFNF